MTKWHKISLRVLIVKFASAAVSVLQRNRPPHSVRLIGSISCCDEWCPSPSVRPPAALPTSHRGVDSLTLPHSARWCVCVCGIWECVSSHEQRNENEKTASPRLIYIHSISLIGQSVGCVFPVSTSISAPTCDSVTDSGCGFLCNYPPCTEVKPLTEIKNKLNQREVNDCRCARLSVCVLGTLVREKNSSGKQFLLCIVVFFFTSCGSEVYTGAPPITFSHYSKA